MKKLICLITFTIFFISCSAPKTVFNGKEYVTEKRFFKETKKSVNKVLKQMSKEEKEILLGSKIIFKYNKNN